MLRVLDLCCVLRVLDPGTSGTSYLSTESLLTRGIKKEPKCELSYDNLSNNNYLLLRVNENLVFPIFQK